MTPLACFVNMAMKCMKKDVINIWSDIIPGRKD